MNRREFITLLGGAAAAASVLGTTTAHAQRAGKVWRIGFLASAERPVSIESAAYGGFLQGMRELGHVEGRDFVMEWRFVEGRFELYPVLAAELVRAQVDIVVAGNSAAVRPMQQASSSIPIVVAVATTRWGLASSPAWRIPAVMSPGWQPPPMIPLPSNWTCWRRQCPNCLVWEYYRVQTTRIRLLR